jgi:AcrR family transcriptional regulator
MTLSAATDQPIVEPLSRRETAAQDKLNRIINAATILFAEKGFHGTAIPEVANAASVGAGTIYRYFENKEDLVNGVFVHCKTKLKFYLEANVASSKSLSQEEQFGVFWDNLCLFVRDNPKEFYFLEMHEHSKNLTNKNKELELEVLAPLLKFPDPG